MPKLKFPGVPVYMNGQNYYVPSLSARQFRENLAVLKSLPAQGDDESPFDYTVRVQDTILPIIELAIQRNYPEITQGNLLDWAGNDVLMEAWRATQGASGMTAVTEGE